MNELPIVPAWQDVLIQERRGRFVVGLYSSPPQIQCRTFDEAFERAQRFASRREVRLWFAGPDGQVRPVASQVQKNRERDRLTPCPCAI